MTENSTKSGRLIAVVGESCVGNDSFMQGLHDVMPSLHLVRQVVTRAPELADEAYDAVSVQEFQDMAEHGAFALHWHAHGLLYGIPVTIKYHLNRGTDCLANFSWTALAEASALFARLVILNISANSDTLAARHAAPGHEDAEEIAKRQGESEKPLPRGLDVTTLSNEGPLSQTIARAVILLQQDQVTVGNTT